MMATRFERARKIYVTGLRNAHALESQATEIMSRQVERYQNYPEVTRRLKQHIQETQVQQQRVDELLQSLGERPSTLKDMALGLMGSLAALGHTVAEDEILKNSFANLAFENFEIASYKALITVAEATGHDAALAPLQQTLREEQDMARWVDEHLREITLKYLSIEERGGSGKT